MNPSERPQYPDDAIAEPFHKGRGALSNESSRYDKQHRIRTDDGWQGGGSEGSAPPAEDGEDEELPPLRTTLTRDATRTIIARNNSPDIGFDRSINPYRGCEHGCIYCFARPTHAYLGLSPGLDPYQPVERELQVTREILQVLSDFNHPVGIVTKNHMVTRDIDILSSMAQRGLAEVFLSVTTLDKDLARKMEPRASAPHRRLEAIRALSAAGIPTGVMTAPMIPGLNDHEMESILEAAAGAGAQRAGYVPLRLPLEIKELFEDWLRTHRPDRADRVLSLIRQMRGGKLYDSEFGSRMRGEGPLALLLSQRFATANKRLGLNRVRNRLDTTKFKVPDEARLVLSDAKRDTRQLRLL